MRKSRRTLKSVTARSLWALLLASSFGWPYAGTSAIAADSATREAMRLAEEARSARPPLPPWWQPHPALTPGAYPRPFAPSTPPFAVPVRPAGRVLLVVDPVDAEVYVDGLRLQQLPDLSYQIALLAGAHRLEVRREGYRTAFHLLDVPPGAGLYLPVSLER